MKFNFNNFRKYWYKILDTYKSINNMYQRSVKGYCDDDVINIDWWFVKTFSNILQEYKRIASSYPANMSSKEWKHTIDKMLYYLYEMGDDNTNIIFNNYMNNIDSHNGLKDKLKNREISITDYRRICKDRFMQLFNNYFYYLWD